MSQQVRVKLPGTLYVVDLTLNPGTNTGKVVLERKAIEAQKTLSDLSLGSIQSVLLDLLESKGLHPNPRLINRVIESELEEAQLTTPTVKVTEEVQPKVDLIAKNPLLKVKDIIAAANSQVSKLDSLLIESPDMPAEVEPTMKSLRNLLTQAKNVITDVLSS